MRGIRTLATAAAMVLAGCSVGRDLDQYNAGADAGGATGDAATSGGNAGSGGASAGAGGATAGSGGASGGASGGSGGVSGGSGFMCSGESCGDRTCCAEGGELSCVVGGCSGFFVECLSPVDCPESAPVCCMKESLVSCTASTSGCDEVLCSHPSHCQPNDECFPFSGLGPNASTCF